MSGPAAPRAYLLEIDADRVAELYARGGIELRVHPLEALATALASSAPLESDGPWGLAVRIGRTGVVGAVGRFPESSVPRLEAIRWQVDESLGHLRYLDDEAVRRHGRTLAEAVRAALGEELRDARFTAIPRGGHVILAYLAYFLDLRPEQMDEPDDGRPWVVVDDCSISGLRFRELLEARDPSDVTFAHLASHPDLRSAVEADVRVRRCLGALDLHDHAPGTLGDGYAPWRARWDERQRGRHFWLGKPDHVCFPWSEPDVGIWNGVLQREDPGWRVVPPSHCVKNRVRFDARDVALHIGRGPGPVRPAPGVIHVRLGEEVVVARPSAETVLGLAGTGGAMWEALERLGTVEASVAALADAYDVEPTRLRADLEDFLASLRSAGLVEIAGDELETPS